eukprot:380632-Amphidinium_carterae.2
MFELTSGTSVPLACAASSAELALRGKRKAVKLLRQPLYRDAFNQRLNTPTPSSMSSVPQASSVMQRAALT